MLSDAVVMVGLDRGETLGLVCLFDDPVCVAYSGLPVDKKHRLCQKMGNKKMQQLIKVALFKRPSAVMLVDIICHCRHTFSFNSRFGFGDTGGFSIRFG